MTLDDYLRDMPLKKQVEALRSYLAYTEKERDQARELARGWFKTGRHHAITFTNAEELVRMNPWLGEG